MTNLSPVPYKVVRGGSAEDAPPGSVPVNLFGVETGGGGGGEGLPEGSVGTWVGTVPVQEEGLNYSFKYRISSSGDPSETSLSYYVDARVKDGNLTEPDRLGVVSWYIVIKVDDAVPSMPPGSDTSSLAGSFEGLGLVSTPSRDTRIMHVLSLYGGAEVIGVFTGLVLEEGNYALVTVNLKEEEFSDPNRGISVQVTV